MFLSEIEKKKKLNTFDWIILFEKKKLRRTISKAHLIICFQFSSHVFLFVSKTSNFRVFFIWFISLIKKKEKCY